MLSDENGEDEHALVTAVAAKGFGVDAYPA